MERVYVPPTGNWADANILPRHPADRAAWIWAGEWHPLQAAFRHFQLKVETGKESLHLHVTADQQLALYLDGVLIARGPDRSDPDHWAVASYPVEFTTGAHLFEAIVWWLPPAPATDQAVDPAVSATPSHHTDWIPPSDPPAAMGQMTLRPGFLLCATAEDGEPDLRFTTGQAPWLAQDLTPAVTTKKIPFPTYHDVGPSFTFRLKAWEQASPCSGLEIVATGIAGNPHGVQRPGWRLEPSPLPEQRRELLHPGFFRAITQSDWTGPFQESSPDEPQLAPWQKLLKKQTPVTLQPGETITLLWDLEDYCCGWLEGNLQGRGTLQVEWAESLYVPNAKNSDAPLTEKGNRDEISGKYFHGFGDVFIAEGGSAPLPQLAWRCGRYLRLVLQAREESLTLAHLGIRTTGYPLQAQSQFECDDPKLTTCLSLMIRTLQTGAHDVWADSPYYEQMAYVGDNLIDALGEYTLDAKSQLSSRMLRLFDWSRRSTGFLAERYPSQWHQASGTYALLWPLLIRQHAWWRNEPELIASLLPGMRANLDQLHGFTKTNGTLRRLPGWSFVDWVDAWPQGVPPGAEQGDSAILNLQWALSLQKAAELETHFGSMARADEYQQLVRKVGHYVWRQYWNDTKKRLSDDSTHRSSSEHVHALALLLEGMPSILQQRCLEVLNRSPTPQLQTATPYWTHYVLEALTRHHQEEALHHRLQRWHRYSSYGLRTMPEKDDPSRSDCHAWSTHPLWHLYASVAGIRPAEPGFRSVRISPLLASLRQLKAKLPHPKGSITLEIEHHDNWHVRITLPQGCSGRFHSAGQTYPLSEAQQVLDLTAEPQIAV